MVGKSIISLVLLAACVAAAPAPDPAPAAAPAEEKPLTPAELKAQRQAETLADVAPLPVVKAQQISDVLSIELRDNDLAISTRLTPTDDSVVKIPSLPGVSRIRVNMSQTDPTQMVGFDFSNLDFGPADFVAIHTSIGMAGGQVTIFRAYEQADDETHTVQLIQRPDAGEGEPRVTMFVQITGQSPVRLTLTANNVVELRHKYPAEVATHLDPVFRTLRQNGFLARVEPRLAWQVFADSYEPTPQLRSQVSALVTQLDAQNFRERQNASAELETLGEPAALVIMRMDRKPLSDEQLARVDALLARFKVVPDQEAAQLRRERDFLLDCLYSDEEIIRRSALIELRTLTGKTIEFDLSADSDARLVAISRLRQQIGARPTTEAVIKD